MAEGAVDAVSAPLLTTVTTSLLARMPWTSDARIVIAVVLASPPVNQATSPPLATALDVALPFPETETAPSLTMTSPPSFSTWACGTISCHASIP